MSIMPIDPAGNVPRITPVQPVQRPQSAALRFKLPGAELAERQTQRRKPVPGRRITIREEGWIREYGVLPDGTRILLSEERNPESHSLPLPRKEEPVIVDLSPQDDHDPENRMKASGRKLKSLLEDVAQLRRLRE